MTREQLDRALNPEAMTAPSVASYVRPVPQAASATDQGSRKKAKR